MSLSRRTVLIAVVCIATGVIAASAAAEESSQPVDFNRDVAPIFNKHCIACHGPDRQEGGLRLDHRATALRGGDSGTLLKPSAPSESRIYERVSSDDESVQMPPPYEDDVRPLSETQIATIRRWIEQGAVWPDDGKRLVVKSDHWAYQPIVRHPPPPIKNARVENAAWVRNPIDNFILARLEAAGVAPSPEADRYTLIKRLYYDLHGLPPEPAVVDEFVNDPSPEAYENLVDRLLDSEHFGERWGRHWLDKARYADSDGYEKDNPRPNAWKYRDWVVDAINADVPFDRFTKAQLAGDLLPDAGRDEKLATAFHRQTLTNTEGGTDQEEFRVAAVVDRVNTTGTVWLGLTVACAQCHSHKYDQITQAEYYQLFAFFNNGDETNISIPKSAEAQAEYDRLKKAHDAELHAVGQRIDSRRKELASKLPEWIAATREKLAAQESSTIRFHPLEVVKVESKAGATLKPLEDGSWLAAGTNPASDTYTIITNTPVKDLTGVRLDALAHDSLPSKGPGRVAHGNFVLSEFRLYASADDKFDETERVALSTATADFSQKDWDVKGALQTKPKTGWAVAPQFGKDHHAVFSSAETFDAAGSTFLKIVLDQQYGSQHTIGRLKLQAKTGTEPGLGLPAEVQTALSLEPANRTAEQNKTLLDHFASLDKQIKTLNKELVELKKRAPKSPLLQVRVVTQREKSPRKTYLLRRGDFLQPQTDTGELVPDGLAVLHELKPRNPDRLDLANWLVSDANPLTPRVAVNHMWSHLFGRGLVRTINDFGVRGEKPTHPQLLDWLADEFKRLHWSRKALIQRIVTSAAYRQSSRHRPELIERDPTNDLLYRQNRFRVEAEIVRDLHLAASGLLSRKVGGPSVFPPMPADVAALSYANNFKWNVSKGGDRYRRGLYTFFKRTAPHPNLVVFDCPDSNTTSVDRRTSNTPLMALATLNNEVFIESAQAMAKRVLTENMKTDDARLTRAFRLCTARPPEEAELAALRELLAASRAHYKTHAADAKQLVGEHQPQNVTPEEAAAWVATMRIVMNMDEFVTRE